MKKAKAILHTALPYLDRRLRCLSLLYVLITIVPLRAEEVPHYPPPAEVEAAFLKLLDRPKVDPAITIDSQRHQDGFILEHATFTSEKKSDGAQERVPMLIVKPERAKGKLPAVIVLHGTGGSMTGMIPV